MNVWEFFGFMGIVLTATQLLPQIIKSLKSKNAKDLSSGLMIVVGSNAITWIIYGIHLNDYPVIIANILNFICASTLLVLKIKLSDNKAEETSSC